MEKRPFEGVKILDFTSAGGATTINIFAFYGADVIKVESREHVDLVRTCTPYKDGIPGLERSGYWGWTHVAPKMDITLNLNHPKGVELAKKLVLWADIVAENFVAGMIEKWGLGYDDLKKIKPDIIMWRNCVHGQTGPWASRPGLGTTVTSLSGFNSIVGWPDREPCGFGGAIFSDFVFPPFNVACIIAALDYKRRTGKGQCLDISQHEANIHFLAPLMLDYTVNQRELHPCGNRSAYASPHGVYRCRGDDRWCAIAVFTDEEWENFCTVIGNPAWTMDSKFTTLHGRIRNAEELDKLVEQWTVNFTPEEVTTLMQAAGVAAGTVENAGDLTHDPQLRYYHGFEELDHPVLGKLSYHLSPGVRLSETDYEMARAPLLGEHNDYVYTKILGISDKEFVQLMEEGVI